MKQLKKISLMLVALLSMTAGAWAQGSEPNNQPATDEITVNRKGTTNQWEFTMPDADVELTPIYAPEFTATFKAGNDLTIQGGKATVTVTESGATTGTQVTLDESGKYSPLYGEETITLTAAAGYKFRKVEVKKGGDAPEYYDQLSAGYNVTIDVINQYAWSQNIFEKVGFTSAASNSVWYAMTITKEQAIALAEYKGSTSLVLYDKGEGSDNGIGGKFVLYKFAKSDGTTVDIEENVYIKNNPSILQSYTVYYIPKNAN